MKKMNKKGFTIVELVIVIAVIAILAAVMIPTFGGIIKKANLSATQQEATAAYKEAYALAIADGNIVKGVAGATEAADTGDCYRVNGYIFVFDGSLEAVTCQVTPPSDVADDYDFAISGNQITVTEN